MATQASPYAAIGHPRRWLILGILCTCLVLVVASVSSLNLALPTIQKALGATQTELQWIVDAYALVFAGLLLFAGALGDRFGRKWTLLIGLAIFGVGAVVASTATSPTTLIAIRAAMGIGAALIMPATLSLLTSVFPPHERQKAIAVWAGFAGAGGAIGVVTTGILLEHFWWGSVFFVTVPIVVGAFAAIAIVVPNAYDADQRPLDPVGAVLSMVGLGALLYAIIEGPTLGWASPAVVGGFVLGALVLVGFVAWEARLEHPMLDPRLFRIRRFGVGATTITLAFFAMFGFFFLVTQYFQYVRGYGPLKAGVATLPFPITMIIVAPRGPRIAERITIRLTMALGLGLTTFGLLWISLAGRSTAYWLLVPGMVLMAGGMGLATPSSTASIMSSLPLDKAGVGSAVNDTTREVGGAMGIAVLGSVLASVYRSSLGTTLDALPAGARGAARDNIGAAVGTAKDVLGGDPGALGRFVGDIGDAFVKGMNAATLVGALATAIGAVIVLRFYPRDRSLAAANASHDLAAAPPAEAKAEA
jgi:DHA2 family multidrug resistance protein-like MFS transporter